MAYATTTQLADILGIKETVPSWDVAGTPTNESVGTGDNSTATFYLDHQNVLASSYTLYKATTAMTETTHYTLNLTTGTITLTATGITYLGTSALNAAYSYLNNGMTDSYLSTAISRADKEVDNLLNTTFTDGTATNPSYPSTTEIQDSMGLWHDRIITNKKPLIDISSLLASDITAAATSLTVTTGDGTKFPTTGYIVIGSEVIAYTGITTNTFSGLTRGSLGTTAAAHTSGDAIHTTILMYAETDEGTDETFEIEPWDTDMYATANGEIYRFRDNVVTPLTKVNVANRVKIIYYYGNSTVPVDITRLSLIFAKRQLVQDNITKAMISGRNEFRPEMFEADNNEINRIVNTYIVFPMGNT